MGADAKVYGKRLKIDSTTLAVGSGEDIGLHENYGKDCEFSERVSEKEVIPIVSG